MELNQEILDRVLTLSHLEIDESKKSELVAQLQGVLDTMEHLNSLNLDDVDPNEWTAGQSTPFREDVAVDAKMPLTSENAPDWTDGAFRVPQILGGES